MNVSKLCLTALLFCTLPFPVSAQTSALHTREMGKLDLLVSQ